MMNKRRAGGNPGVLDQPGLAGFGAILYTPET
jgi:hypothetical protein